MRAPRGSLKGLTDEEMREVRNARSRKSYARRRAKVLAESKAKRAATPPLKLRLDRRTAARREREKARILSLTATVRLLREEVESLQLIVRLLRDEVSRLRAEQAAAVLATKLEAATERAADLAQREKAALESLTKF